MRWLRKLRGMANQWIIARRRNEALRLQFGLCFYCDEPLQPEKATADHVVPLSANGHRRKQSNIVAACGNCNHAKGDRLEMPAAYLRQRKMQHLRGLGLRASAWSRELDNFGRDPDGHKLWAPQYGILGGPPCAPVSPVKQARNARKRAKRRDHKRQKWLELQKWLWDQGILETGERRPIGRSHDVQTVSSESSNLSARTNAAHVLQLAERTA